MPSLDETARRRIVREVWDNLGRTTAELPHLANLRKTSSGPGWELEGEDIMRAQAERGGPAIFVSGHIGNWELLPPVVAHYGMVFSSIYRAPNNPHADRIITEFRRKILVAATQGAERRSDSPVELFGKGLHGARAVFRHLSQGFYLGALIDQKMNEGIESTLFGQKAMTSSGTAALALRLKCPVIPGHVERVGPARFRLFAEQPLPLPDTGDRHADIAILTQQINDCLERWIRAKPGSWLWLHRRFPKPLYRREATAPAEQNQTLPAGNSGFA